MKNQTKTILLFAGIVLAGAALAQQPTGEINKEKMKALSYLAGKWEGSGSMTGPGGQKESFSQKESISYELGGTILHIRGEGFDDSGVQRHNALGILYYDEKAAGYRMTSFLENGQRTTAEVALTPDGFDWWFTIENGATIKYVITVKDGVWTEKGYYSPDGQAQYPYIDFQLKRISD